MLRTIYKYHISPPINRVFHISLPLNAEVLSIKQREDNEIVLYALIDPTETARKKYSIYAFYTGEVTKEKKMENLKFLDTIIIDNLVYHFFIGDYQDE